MFKVKSFKIEDDKGQNELLEKYRLADGGILVSNGIICINYDDGQPEDAYHMSLLFKELRNKKQAERQMAMFEQKLVEKQNVGFETELADLKEKESNSQGKEIKERIKLMENKVADSNNQKLIAQAKIEYIDDQIGTYEEMIKENEG